jgi:hypothetical protein
MRKRNLLCGAALLGLATSGLNAAVITYTDTQGDQVGSTNKARDIWSVTVTNDASNLIVTINLDPGATLGTVSFDYGIGITTGPGANGDLGTDATNHGNPYKRTISIASSQGGMTDWIGLFPAGGAGTVASPWTSYGFNDYVWNGTTSSWGTAVDTVSTGQPMATQNSQTGLSSITLTVPMADFSNLGLQPGSTFLFDVYSTGTSAGQTAYDSLADPSATNATNSATTQYDGSLFESYTVQAVPEPMSLGLLSCGGLLLLKRRSKI